MLYLIDASLYMFRAYHSQEPIWRDQEGWPTHAVHGFANFLIGLLLKEKPEHIAVCFDEALGSSFRNDFYPAYKANREPADEDLTRQFAHAIALTRDLGLCACVDQRYEADDLIGSMSHRARAAGMPVTIVSADKDMGQLIGPHDLQWDYGRADAYGPEGVKAKHGVNPEQLVDLLALTGDSVDNIPGVAGVGPKTAAQLLTHFGDLDQIYARVHEIAFLRTVRGAGTLGAKLSAGRDKAMMSRRLAQIALDAPIPDEAALRRKTIDRDALGTRFDSLGFGRLLRGRVAPLFD